MTVNALTAATSVLIPTQCEYYALEGLSQLIATLNLVRDNLNPTLAIKGVVLTMFDARTNLSSDVASEVRGHFGHAVFDTVIPRSVRLSEAPSFGLPIALYRADSRGAEAYAALAAELLRRDGREPATPGTPETTRRPTGRDPRALASGRRHRPDPRHGTRRDRSPFMTIHSERQSGLGRGLASLIPQRAQPNGVTEIPLARIEPNPRQPRQRFDADQLEALAASIREHGVLQPILVTETLDGYQLVAGERRFRAARLAGLERIPAVIRQLADRAQLEVALVENLQRADLGPMEEAAAYRSLVEEFGLTHEEIARRVGRAKSTITNTLRLLDLDPARPDRPRRRPSERGSRARPRPGCPSSSRAGSRAP